MSKKKLVILLLPVLLILMVVLSGQRSNPKIERTVNWDSPQTRTLFYRACANCHSHETKWPWYSHVAPVSWLIIHNVNEGRDAFNISGMKLGEAEDAPKMIQKGKMPPADYLLLHSEAKLTSEEKTSLIEGLTKTFGHEEKNEENQKAEEDDD